jgi:hypothetical protein
MSFIQDSGRKMSSLYSLEQGEEKQGSAEVRLKAAFHVAFGVQGN